MKDRIHPNGSMKWREVLVAYTMLLPTLVLFAIFVGLPMILAVVIAFKHIDLAAGLGASPWVGLQNFRDLFGNILISERIHRAFMNTLLFTAIFVPLNIIGALVVATLIEAIQGRGKTFYRAAYYLPTVTSAIVFAMIWKWLYDANFGLLNYLLGTMGIGPINWTGDPDWAMWAVIFAALGAGPGANIIIYLAALTSVPKDTMEAATVDGANSLLRWWTVTVPALKPVTLYLIVLNTIGSFQVFELVFILTGGGPAGASTVIVYEIYSLAFIQGRYGIAGALSLILLLIVAGFTVVQFFLFGTDTTRETPRGIHHRLLEKISDGIGSILNRLGNWVDGFLAAVRQRIPKTGRPGRKFPVFRDIPIHLLLLPMALLFLFPMAWMFLSAFTPRVYLQANPPRISAANFSLENYTNLLSAAPNLLRWIWNSLYLSFFIMAVQVLLSCLAGFVFARLLFPGRKLIFGLLIMSIILPGQALIIPLFIVISSGIRGWFGVDIINTHWALILPALCSPVGIFLMRQYIENIPRELDEAARMDGCSDFFLWWRIILPLCRPVIGAWGILTFTAVWRSFFWPFVVLGSDQLFTLEVGLQTLQQQNVADYGLIMAGATASAIPMIIVFFIFQKQIVTGLTFGAVKG
ncbi:MAG: ABC transporter permease subunit [Candidatus Sumerlaeia bacterium]|nr:ABC transporter permease subunit [Candidatus Sumerlaeia bacterium]